MNDLTTTNTTSAVPVQAGMAGLMNMMLNDPAKFEHICRVAKIYAHSPLFPEHLRKGGIEAAVGNAVLVMNIASRLNEDALTVAQNIYFVGGKPGWSASYMIAKANQHGAFREPIDWDVVGEGDKLKVTAFGKTAKTGKRVEVTMSMDTAKKEGWTSNKKYQSMPEQMLRYRTATALIRLYCPEVMVGIPSEVEIDASNSDTMRDVTPKNDALAAITGGDGSKPKAATESGDPAYTYDPETGEVDADEPKKVSRAKPAPAVVEKPEPEPKIEAEQKIEEKAEPKVEDKPEPEARGISDGGDERPEPQEQEVSAKILNLRKSILGDLESIGEADAVQSFYAEQLAMIRTEAPAIFSELQAAFDAHQS